MKYDKFLLTLTLCISISSNISFAQQATGWGSSATAVYNVMQSHGAKIFNAGSGFMTNISTPIFNIMSSWSPNKIFSVVIAGLATLIISYGMYMLVKLSNYLMNEGIGLLINDDSSPEGIAKAMSESKSNPQIHNKYKEILKNKYAEDYRLYLQSVNITERLLKIQALMEEVSNNEYTFSKEGLKAHNIIVKKGGQRYWYKQPARIPGFNWGNDGLRYNALKNIQTEEGNKIKEYNELQKKEEQNLQDQPILLITDK